MKLDFAHERVLAVVAHPDDLELLCAGTLARAAADGAAVGTVVLCRGDKGAGVGVSGEELADVRRAEMGEAAALLGAELHLAGFSDGELADTPAHRRPLISIFREFRPTLVIAHSSADYHADHRAASALAEAVSWFACSAGHVTGESPLERPPAVWWADTVNMAGFTPGFYVDVSAQMDLKRRMLACHRSQLQRGGSADFEPLEKLMTRQASTRGSQAGVEAAEAFCIHPAWKRLRAW